MGGKSLSVLCASQAHGPLKQYAPLLTDPEESMITPGKVYPGSVQRLTINLQSTAGVDTDPTALTFKLMDPMGTETTYTYGTDAQIVKTSTGDYYVDVVPDRGGRWFYRWVSTGSAAGAQEGNFIVQASPFIDYVEPRAYGR